MYNDLNKSDQRLFDHLFSVYSSSDDLSRTFRLVPTNHRLFKREWQISRAALMRWKKAGLVTVSGHGPGTDFKLSSEGVTYLKGKFNYDNQT